MTATISSEPRKTGSGITLSDIDVTIPADASGSVNCLPANAGQTGPATGNPLKPLLLSSTPHPGAGNRERHGGEPDRNLAGSGHRRHERFAAAA